MRELKYSGRAEAELEQVLQRVDRTVFRGRPGIAAGPQTCVTVVDALNVVLHCFAFNSADVPDRHIPLINQIAGRIIERKIRNVTLIGHTDNAGTDARNFQLGLGRARSVELTLRNAIDLIMRRQGIAPWPIRFWSDSLGKKQPAVPNTTPENRATNRRVAITLGCRRQLVLSGFKVGEYQLQPHHYAAIERFFLQLKAQGPAGAGLELRGFTDNGAEGRIYSFGLAFARAIEAGKFFEPAMQKRAIPARIVKLRGLGTWEPIDLNATEPGRRNNRRVEVWVCDP
jgi:outer membrane protein OmpA-like peptidoglycan-associated protein